MSGKRPSSAALLKSLPTRWVVGIVVLLVAYGLLQPIVNQRFGWKLPSLASLQQGDTQQYQRPPAVSQVDEEPPDVLVAEPTPPPPSATPANNPAATPSATPSDTRSESQRAPRQSTGSDGTANTSQLLYGLLRETATDDYLSPGGLRYTRGSAEGHRLKHIERHLEDDPNRPGKHGVFDGDMPQVIRWIDEAYALAIRGARGTRKTEEDGRIVYEASFNKPIGFIGGRDGRRDRNPEARRLRLVVEGNKVITAFPF